MESVKITTVDTKTGLVHDFTYECHSNEILIAIIKGTLEGCGNQGWAMTEMEVI